MKKILLISRDPGGTNTLLPVYYTFREKYQMLVYGKDFALKIWKKKHINCIDVSQVVKIVTKENVLLFLSEVQPDLIITGTSADDNFEKYIWYSAEKLKIPSFAILDQWVNYGMRFSKYSVANLNEFVPGDSIRYLPTKVLAMDIYARQMLIKDGVPNESIVVTGQPHFEQTMKDYEIIPDETVRNYLQNISGGGHFEHVIIFASEDICKSYIESESTDYYIGYTEKTIFTAFNNVLEKFEDFLSKTLVIIRPHPKEDMDEWEKIFRSQKIHYVIDGQSDTLLLIKCASLVCGMSSMFLIESAICRKKVMSIQIGLKIDDPCILSQIGKINTITSEQDLEKNFSAYFSGNYADIYFENTQNAVDNVVHLVEGYI